MEFKIGVIFVLVALQGKIGYAHEQCIIANNMTVSQIGLAETQFWTSKSQDLEQCAKLCIRLKPCKSVTYNTTSHWCELNSGTKQDAATRAGESLLYSERVWWPPIVIYHFLFVALVNTLFII